MRTPPVHHISDFKTGLYQDEFYASSFEQHVKKHHFIGVPHKHDFYLCVMFTRGKGTHMIDFKKYEVKPGAVFFLSPGQLHHWELSKDTRGYIFFHSAGFYDWHYHHLKARDFPFYHSLYQQPVSYLSGRGLQETGRLMKDLLEAVMRGGTYNREKICAVVTLIYISLARLYKGGRRMHTGSHRYLAQLHRLEALVDAQYRTVKSPSAYAAQMGVTRKHLNRICRDGLNKTVSDMIADRVTLEAKRLLVQGYSAAQVADELGYIDRSYFSRFFKKHTGETTLAFLHRQAN